MPIDRNQPRVVTSPGDGRLEALEARRHRGPVVLDLAAELRQPLRAVGEDVVDDVRDGRLPRGELDRRSVRELEIGDVLVPEAAPDAALGRDLARVVVAAPDQVEDRRGELERARLAALPQQRRDERRLGVRRRLLLVLAVVACADLASEAPEDERRDGERGQDAERQEDERRPPGMRDRVVDPLLVALVLLRVVELLGDDLVEPVAVRDPHAGRRREGTPRVERAQLDELVRGHVRRPGGSRSFRRS